MRVIGGSAKGHRLRTPRGGGTRPVTDNVKETIFNVIGDGVVGAEVLDLYAGTGSLGIEALSRGAERILFVEQAAEAVRLIEQNLKMLGFGDQAEIWRDDVFRALRRMRNRQRGFELVFVDPPFEKGLSVETMHLLSENQVVAEGGCVVVRHHQKETVPSEVDRLQLVSEKSFAEAVVGFFLLLRSN